jgi:hypothetical protein
VALLSKRASSHSHSRFCHKVTRTAVEQEGADTSFLQVSNNLPSLFVFLLIHQYIIDQQQNSSTASSTTHISSIASSI